ncbi:uncharacterized protein DNG_01608 [Cephalotrichum gorgonifer]|uniref:Kelch repeat-containing protein n=1 Tax=Cephalotrichum gorgonifer TaxID=2041049 RepID=A0AAE8MTB8_9PEZI|nr:uncharacterized protein DNG_01608 [Cephalotrichum gorgonifer]
MVFPTARGIALALMGTAAQAQYSGWDKGQVNSTMCLWKLPRVRDTVFIDGGALSWSQGMETGEYQRGTEWDPKGQVLSLSLRTSFTIPQNFTPLFQTHPKSNPSKGEISPIFSDGSLLANDDRFLLYGGVYPFSDSYPDPPGDSVVEFQAYPAGDSGTADFSPAFADEELPRDVTRYLAYGAGVSAPSENKAWYFSGLRSPSGGVIYEGYGVPEAVASNISDTLISVTFSDKDGDEDTWRNETIQDKARGRGGAAGVFVPVGEQGILVFVGGATFPEFAYATHKSENPAAQKSESGAFMSTVDVYDIASGKWYQQKTNSPSASPPILAQSCAVAQHAADLSSFNIYVYGGYGAVDKTSDFSDDVWILSLPSFTWVRGLSGTSDHARAGHKCVTPYPDQMMVVGGWIPTVGKDCLLGGVIQMLNLTSVEWMDGYDPEKYGEYGVPEVVVAEIGGDASGGATAKSPSGGWDDDGLEGVFGKAYATEKIKNWYPYQAAESTERPNVDDEKNRGGGGGGLPDWVPPTLGCVLGLIVVVVCGVGIFFWRRRKALRRASMIRDSVQSGLK